MALGWTQPLVKIGTRNIPGVKGGRCTRLASPSSRAECHEIWEPKPPGTLWATSGLLRDCFTVTSVEKIPSVIKIRQEHRSLLMETYVYL